MQVGTCSVECADMNLLNEDAGKYLPDENGLLETDLRC
jgi:hypothetical protein